jgi:ribulose-5-phosphate 4-epimerase/fuculose-1-phosphate aldolase
MKPISDKQKAAFVDACHKAAVDYGLMLCSSGNMSWRVDDQRMLVTATRTWLSHIHKDQVAVVRIADGTVLNDCRPSVESAFHTGVLQKRPDRNVVLHFQTPFATTLACTDLSRINFNVIPEIPYYIGKIAVVPYLAPGSPELAAAVIQVMKTHDLAVLRNHGMVVVGETFDDTLQKAVFFELACGIIVRAGKALKPLPDKVIPTLMRTYKPKTP